MAGDDGSTESEGAAVPAASSVVTGPSSTTTDVESEAQLRAAAWVLRNRGQRRMAALALLLSRFRLDTALLAVDTDERLQGVDDGDPALFDAFRRQLVTIHRDLLQRALHDDEDAVFSRVFRHMVLRAARQAAGLTPAATATIAEPYHNRNGGFGAVPATAAAMRSLEKQTLRVAAAAGGNNGNGGDAITECGICFEEFVDGAEVSVMPCPCRGHRFHPECIAKWLGISNMCPLCRHKLPF